MLCRPLAMVRGNLARTAESNSSSTATAPKIDCESWSEFSGPKFQRFSFTKISGCHVDVERKGATAVAASFLLYAALGRLEFRREL